MARKNKALKVSLLGFCFIFIPSVSSHAADIEGWVVTSYESLILVRTERGSEEVILLRSDEDPVTTDIKYLREGDHIRIKTSNEFAGLKIAREITPVREIELSEPGIYISTPELFNLISAGDRLLIDIRPYERYRAGHIPSAISLPHDRLKPEDLPDDRLVVLYSDSMRGPFMKEIAENALLQGKKIRVYRGLERWIRDGYYVMVEPGYIKEKGEDTSVFIDTRPSAETYIPGAIQVLPEKLDTGELLRGEAGYPIVFYGNNDNDSAPQRAALIASLSGYALRSQEPVRVLKGGIKAWIKEGLPLEKGKADTSLAKIKRPVPEIVSYNEFEQIWETKDKSKIILDVRTEAEVQGLPVNGTINISVMELPYRLSELPNDKEIIVFCSRGIRARIAYHILKKNGYRARYLNTRPQTNPDGTLKQN